MIEKESEKQKLRATLQAMKKARGRGRGTSAKNNDNIMKPEQKERSFRQQEEFGAKKRIKP